MVSPFAGRASPLAVSALPSNGEADVPFAPEGVMFFVRAPNWCARVERNGSALPAAPFSGELEARSGEFLCPFAFLIRVIREGILFLLLFFCSQTDLALGALMPLLRPPRII